MTETTYLETRERPSLQAEALALSDSLEARPVGPNTVSVVSSMGENEKLAGNVLRKLCSVGGEVCTQTCVLQQNIVDRAEMNQDGKCADENLNEVIDMLGYNPEGVIMVRAVDDRIGFADEADDNPEFYPISTSPVTGAKELHGFNAYFAREDDTINGDRVEAIGTHMADCGDINLEFQDGAGQKVMGFIHLTRKNLQGKEALEHDYDGRKVGSFESFLRTAMDHYDADLSSVNIRVAAAIKPENFKYTFTGEPKLDELFPGWKTMSDEVGKPLALNRSNPNWEPGKPFSPDDVWEMDFRGMVRWQMNQLPELSQDQIDWDGTIDPGDIESQHASNTSSSRGANRKGRDAYFVAWADK